MIYNLYDTKENILCEYSTDETNTKIIALENVKTLKDFSSLGEWLEYVQDIKDALLLTKKQII